MSRRGDYSSGQDFALEYGDLRYSFNEDDFGQRCEAACVQLEILPAHDYLEAEEIAELIDAVVNGEPPSPALTAFGLHLADVGRLDFARAVRWIRRLVFRQAWIDQRILEGELEPTVIDRRRSSEVRFGYKDPRRQGDQVLVLDDPPSFSAWRYRV